MLSLILLTQGWERRRAGVRAKFRFLMWWDKNFKSKFCPLLLFIKPLYGLNYSLLLLLLTTCSGRCAPAWLQAAHRCEELTLPPGPLPALCRPLVSPPLQCCGSGINNSGSGSNIKITGTIFNNNPPSSLEKRWFVFKDLFFQISLLSMLERKKKRAFRISSSSSKLKREPDL